MPYYLICYLVLFCGLIAYGADGRTLLFRQRRSHCFAQPSIGLIFTASDGAVESRTICIGHGRDVETELRRDVETELRRAD
jgi:hypothetical protein